MDLPSSRELELETLLRQRDAQVTELTDEVTQLRQYLSKQPGPSTSDPVSLPPALVSLLLPHLNGPANNNAQTGSSTVTTALTQRAKLLQEENDELYEMLKTGETGRLKEEVRGLKRAVGRLETALRESHQVIRTLSEELDKSYETILSTGRHPTAHAHSQAPRQSHRQSPALSQTNSNGTSKPLPTGPRAHKKPRLDPQVQAQPQPQAQPSPSSSSSTTTLPRIQTQTQNSSNNNSANPTANSSNSANTRPAVETTSVERSPVAASPDHRKVPGGMKVEINEDAEDSSSRARESALPRDRGRNRERERDKDKGRERDKERDRDRDRLSKRNGGPGHGSGGVGGVGGGGSGGSGGGSGGGGGGGRGGGGGAKSGNRSARGSFSSAVDRTLAQRMGMGRYSGPG